MATTRKKGLVKNPKASLRFRVRARSIANQSPLTRTRIRTPLGAGRSSKRRSTFNAHHHPKGNKHQGKASNQVSWPQRSSLRRALLESAASQNVPGLLSTNPTAGSPSVSPGLAVSPPTLSISTTTGGHSGTAQDGITANEDVVGSHGDGGGRSLVQEPIAPSLQPQRSSLRRAVQDSAKSQHAVTRGLISPDAKAGSSSPSLHSTVSAPAFSGQRSSLRRAILESSKTTQKGSTQPMRASDTLTSQVTNDTKANSQTDWTVDYESHSSDKKSRKRKRGDEGYRDQLDGPMPLRGSLRLAVRRSQAEFQQSGRANDEVENVTLGDVETVHTGDGDTRENEMLVDPDSETPDLEQDNANKTHGAGPLRRSTRLAVRESQAGSAQSTPSGGVVTSFVTGEIEAAASEDNENRENPMPTDSQDTDPDIEQDYYDPIHTITSQRRSARLANLQRQTTVDQNAKPDGEVMTPALDDTEAVPFETNKSREDDMVIDSNNSEMLTPDQYYDDFDHELRPQRISTRQIIRGSRVMLEHRTEHHDGGTGSLHGDAETTSPKTHDVQGQDTLDDGQKNMISDLEQIAIVEATQALSISTDEPELLADTPPTTYPIDSEATDADDSKSREVDVSANDDYWAAEILRTLSIFRDEPVPISDQTASNSPPPAETTATENNVGGDHELRDAEHSASVRITRPMSISNIVYLSTPSISIDESTTGLDVPQSTSAHESEIISPDNNESQHLDIRDYEGHSTTKSACTSPVSIAGHSRAPNDSPNKRLTRSMTRMNRLSTYSHVNGSKAYEARSNETYGLEKTSKGRSKPALTVSTDVPSSFSRVSLSTHSNDYATTPSLSQTFTSATATTPLTTPSTPASFASNSSGPLKDGRAEDNEDDGYDGDTEDDEANRESEASESELGSSSHSTLSALSVSLNPKNSDLATKYWAEIKKLGTPEMWTKKEKDGRDERAAAARKGWYNIRQIVNEVPGLYFVEWEGTDPRTGVHWPGSWVKAKDVSKAAIKEWEKKREVLFAGSAAGL
ncbi:hypothetical protein GGR57DRAFT_475305 [Xylariaceae sp. FL1272]|nr:hypothetical protein GGR57DRAFT_475305 [Xylariaceae sp. FL1272]